MEALIWDNTSTDGADHGDVVRRVRQPHARARRAGRRPAELGHRRRELPVRRCPNGPTCGWKPTRTRRQITSLVADAQTHGRWHPLGDGYQPQPGDWAVYDGHVEVVTSYADGVLDTIGADSLPGLTVNAHSSGGPSPSQGVVGFVDNGNLKPSGTDRQRDGRRLRNGGASGAGAAPGREADREADRCTAAPALPGGAAIPGESSTRVAGRILGRASPRRRPRSPARAAPSGGAAVRRRERHLGEAAIPSRVPGSRLPAKRDHLVGQRRRRAAGSAGRQPSPGGCRAATRLRAVANRSDDRHADRAATATPTTTPARPRQRPPRRPRRPTRPRRRPGPRVAGIRTGVFSHDLTLVLVTCLLRAAVRDARAPAISRRSSASSRRARSPPSSDTGCLPR